ncbi:alternative ribosome rescue aminoacyl-tRNA hydrolase ArfB [Deltaproteobacteria bacterium]|nr:alternative ribosome rescue aminoacyl-tRNA hydrolase ArfB [Deltaproteobacteria bacterium]
MIHITDDITIDDKEIQEDFILASGPGGQNVNKVATAVLLSFDVRNSPSLPEDVRERLIRIAGKRITREGFLVIKAGRFRTQDRNRQDAVNRLIDLIRRAAVIPKVRRKTKPTTSSRIRRMEAKRRQGEIKRKRRSVTIPED